MKTDIELLKRVHELKDSGVNSLRTSMILGLNLKTTNKLYATSIQDPENKKIWIRESRQGMRTGGSKKSRPQ